MKININAEKEGKEIVVDMVASLGMSSVQAKEEDIKAQVLNKDGKWVDFDINKIRFVYSK